MLYDNNTEYTTKHSDTCYDEDINSTAKTWFIFNVFQV